MNLLLLDHQYNIDMSVNMIFLQSYKGTEWFLPRKWQKMHLNKCWPWWKYLDLSRVFQKVIYESSSHISLKWNVSRLLHLCSLNTLKITTSVKICNENFCISILLLVAFEIWGMDTGHVPFSINHKSHMNQKKYHIRWWTGWKSSFNNNLWALYL